MTKEIEKYNGVVVGSRKAIVRRAFDTKGAKAAEKIALRHELKPNTIRTWFSTWKTMDAKASVVVSIKTPQKRSRKVEAQPIAPKQKAKAPPAKLQMRPYKARAIAKHMSATKEIA